MDRVRMKHAVPQRQRGPVSTMRHGERQSHVTKRSTRRNDDSARPDSDTTGTRNRYQANARGGYLPLARLKACKPPGVLTVGAADIRRAA